jgi:hypothetical protein
MAVIDYPAALPQDFIVDPFGYDIGDNILRTPMDAGPPKTRREYATRIDRIAAEVVMTQAQLDLFMPWYQDVLLDGSLRFNKENFINRAETVEIKFAASPKIRALGNDRYQVHFDLLVLP